MMKKLTLLMCFFALPLQAQTEMTAEEAIRTGLENNYSVRIARNQATIAHNSSGLGTAALLPTLGIDGGTGLSRSDQETNSPFSFGSSDTRSLDATIALNWTLFDGMSMFAEKKRYDELARMGTVQARSIIETTVVEILRAYFDLVQQQMLLDVAMSARDISQTRFDKERVRNELGGASSTDLLNAQVALNNDQANVLDQQLRVEIAQQVLNILLARDPATSFAVKEEITIPPLDLPLEQLLQLALENNSAYRAAQHDANIAQQNIRLARAGFLPRLALNASYGYSDRTTSSDSPNFAEDINSTSKDASVRLNLSLNLFNGFRNRIDVQNARLAAENSVLVLKDARNALSAQVREQHLTLEKRLALVALEEQNVQAAQQNLALQQDRYEIGATSSIEFRDAQVNLIRAESALIAARFQARLSRIAIDRLTGRLEIE